MPRLQQRQRVPIDEMVWGLVNVMGTPHHTLFLSRVGGEEQQNRAWTP